MRNMSFMLTKKQIIHRTKTVTRRLGWNNLEIGDTIQAVEKCQGLKKGQKIKRLCKLKIISNRPTILVNVTKNDCIKEGFPNMSPLEFIEMFCKEMKCSPYTVVNRIQFKYIRKC